MLPGFGGRGGASEYNVCAKRGSFAARTCKGGMANHTSDVKKMDSSQKKALWGFIVSFVVVVCGSSCGTSTYLVSVTSNSGARGTMKNSTVISEGP